MADQQLRSASGSLLECLLAGVDSDGDVSDLFGSFDLESVLRDIAEGFDLEEAVKVFAECGQFDHPKDSLLDLRVGRP